VFHFTFGINKKQHELNICGYYLKYNTEKKNELKKSLNKERGLSLYSIRRNLTL
jgi:hypothetical protein